ncbi:MAG TPA: hypothetical protein VJ890_25905 [Vineibacter sp.]|nr:hypothetical protein [Vineibacter sp.]
MATMFRFAGLDDKPIHVASDAPLLDFTARFFGLWPFDEEGTAIAGLADITIEAIDGGFRLRHPVLEGGAMEVPDAAEAANQLVGLLVAEVLARRKDLLGLHAGVVAAPSGLILFVGDSLCGKSTLALQLARRGADFYGDDRLLVAPAGIGGRQEPVGIGLGLTPRMRLPVHEGAGGALAAFVAANSVVEHMDWQGNPIVAYIDLERDTFAAAPFGDSLPLGAVILPERRDDDPDALEFELGSKGDAALTIMRQSTAPGMDAKGHVAAAALIAGSVPCLRLVYGSSAVAADLVAERFDIR